jgi:hypothetical protein
MLPQALGELALLRGHVSSSWHDAFVEAHTKPVQGNANPQNKKWTMMLIKCLWEYSKAIWEFRNSAVHGNRLYKE